jgi:RNA polymerase sigma-70 factor, ECF subfamily
MRSVAVFDPNRVFPPAFVPRMRFDARPKKRLKPEVLVDPTRQSLLYRAQAGNEPAWRELIELYQPLIRRFFDRHVQRQDAEDLTQEVLAKVLRHLKSFRHNGRAGAFRTWLHTIMTRQRDEFWRTNRRQVRGSGGERESESVAELEDAHGDLSERWEEEYTRYVADHLLRVLERDFGPQTVQAFRRVVLDGRKPAEVAAELGMEVGAVYAAKARVLPRLKEEGEGLLD